MMDNPESALRGRCECGEVFVVAYLPMEMRKAAELAQAARCPKCASRKIFVVTGIDPARSDGGANIVTRHTNIQA